MRPCAGRPARLLAWATSSLIAGILGLLLATLPIPLTSALAWPFLLYALAIGVLVMRSGRRAGDRPVTGRAGWGAGLGCAGAVVEAVQLCVLVGLGSAGLLTLLQSLRQR